MADKIKIACPRCDWLADGRPHWRCTCGHSWNTFDTKAKCPNCGTQWADTYCPRCGQSSKHEQWYTAVSEIASPPVKLKDQAELERRKAIVEGRLAGYGINDNTITFLPYLRFSKTDFQPPAEVGKRILILWAVSYLAQNTEEKQEIEDWLKEWNLWDKVSERERKLFAGEANERALLDFSWQIEGVIVLCWATNLLDDLPGLDSVITDDELDQLMAQLPIEQDPTEFLANLSYRNKEEIFIENIINEMVTSHLRNMMTKEKKDDLSLNAAISFERHYALNWVRRFDENSDWDETDTST